MPFLPHYLEALEDYRAYWWHVDNELYRIVGESPSHGDLGASYAKVVFVNRAYTAGLARTLGWDGEPQVARALVAQQGRIDALIEATGTSAALSPSDLPGILDAHSALCSIVSEPGARSVRSFASKYLHFHGGPESIVPVFDSRAQQRLGSILRDPAAVPLPEIRQLRRELRRAVPYSPQWDRQYWMYCTNFAVLYGSLSDEYLPAMLGGVELPLISVKALDHLLWFTQERRHS